MLSILNNMGFGNSKTKVEERTSVVSLPLEPPRRYKIRGYSDKETASIVGNNLDDVLRPSPLRETVTTEDKFKGVSNSEIIQQIHKSFFTEQDRLIEAATAPSGLSEKETELVDKVEKLRSLGFDRSKENELVRPLWEKIHDNNEKKELLKAIDYFSQKYPQYKLITEKSIKEICKKYDLIFGDVRFYIGTVPDKNLEAIANCNIAKEDKYYQVEYYSHEAKLRHPIQRRGSFEYCSKYENTWENIKIDIPEKEIKPESLVIAASANDFDLDRMDVRDFEIVKRQIPDPVVLHPVVFNEKKYFLIVTAWGEEASDELVVNERMN